MGDFFNFLITSILGSDIYILVWALITFIGTILVSYYSKSVQKELGTSSEKFSNRIFKDNSHMNISEIQEKENRLQKKRIVQTRTYTFYLNAISIFPLLGMLGTVKSLVELSSGMSSKMVMDQFFSALSSTAWGMIFAILFKSIADPLITPRVSLNEIEIELFLDRVSILRDEALKEEANK